MMGLVVRRVDERNMLSFVIADDGAFAIVTEVNGSVRFLTDGWQTSKAIVAGGTNALRVEATGGDYAFSVDEQLLSHVIVADNDQPATFGFLAGGGRQMGDDMMFMHYTVTAS